MIAVRERAGVQYAGGERGELEERGDRDDRGNQDERGERGDRGERGERGDQGARGGNRDGLRAHSDADEADALQDLGDEIATLAAHVHAATHRMLTLIAAFDRWGGWKAGGHRSCAHWLAFRTGVDLGAAREKVRAARALADLPEISESMSRGELSFAKVRALTRVATPENEPELLEYARATTAAGLERLVRGWKRLNRLDEAEAERVRHASRGLVVFPDDDGMYVIRGRLDPEAGAVLMRAIDAASDALYVREREEEKALRKAVGLDDPDELKTTQKQRRADAIGLLAERGLAAGFGESPEMDWREAVREGTAAQGGSIVSAVPGPGPSADPAPGSCPVPVSGSRAERYQVVLHVSAETLAADCEPGRSELDDGTRVSAETSRRLACDGSVVRLGVGKGVGGAVRGGPAGPRDGPGNPTAVPLTVGRKTRTIPPAIRRALEARDRGCRFPGCGLRFTDAHHVRHWADGGETAMGNLVLLCRRHHRAVHEEGFRIEMGPSGQPNFYDPGGRPLPGTPPPGRVGESPVAALIRRNRERGIEPHFCTAKAGFKRKQDIPWRVTAGAVEAVARMGVSGRDGTLGTTGGPDLAGVGGLSQRRSGGP